MSHKTSNPDGPRVEWPRAPGRKPRSAAVVVLEGAAVPELRRALILGAAIDPKALLVAVDGGLHTFRAAKRRPDLFVGDLDSFRGAPPPSIPSKIFPVDKPYSDFAGALAELLRRRVELVVVAGILGGRLDHEWANVLEAGAAAPGFAGIMAPSSRGLIVVTARRMTARTRARRLFSLFALGGGSTVSLRGTRWTLAKRRIRPGSIGLSNVTGTALALDVHAGVVALVFPDPQG